MHVHSNISEDFVLSESTDIVTLTFIARSTEAGYLQGSKCAESIESLSIMMVTSASLTTFNFFRTKSIVKMLMFISTELTATELWVVRWDSGRGWSTRNV